ncbi:hypothetical protein, partial [Enemella evansiae]|uniref:hypothetical protein n=1 Tax=Enemella evansiae TaxID=2016499 RepID=UPI0015C5FCA0
MPAHHSPPGIPEGIRSFTTLGAGAGAGAGAGIGASLTGATTLGAGAGAYRLEQQLRDVQHLRVRAAAVLLLGGQA